MTGADFVHLHLHTQCTLYLTGQSVLRILIARGKENKMSAVAMTVPWKLVWSYGILQFRPGKRLEAYHRMRKSTSLPEAGWRSPQGMESRNPIT